LLSFEGKILTKRNCYLGLLPLRFFISQICRNRSELKHHIKTLRKLENAAVPICISTNPQFRSVDKVWRCLEKSYTRGSSLDSLETKVYIYFSFREKNKRDYLARHRLRGPESYKNFAEHCGRQCSFLRVLLGDQILHLVLCTGECEAVNLRPEFGLQKHYSSC